MDDSTMGPRQLARQLRVGESRTEWELRRLLEPQLVRMVRWALRTGPTSELAHQLIEAINRLTSPPGGALAADPKWLAPLAARQLCTRLIEHLRSYPESGRGSDETVGT